MNDKYLKCIGTELKIIRIEHNMSLLELSNKTKVSTATLCNYENNKTLIFVNKILEILDAYDDITPTIFFERCNAKMQGK